MHEFWKNKTFIIADTETNGLDHVTCGPCEVAMLKIVDGKVQEPNSWLIKTNLKIPPFVQAIHHISNDEIEEAPTLEQLEPIIIDFCKDATIVAHKADFDYSMLPFLQDHDWLCNLRLCHHIWNVGDTNADGHTLNSHKNKVLQHWLDLEVDTRGQAAHRAQADILVTAEIFIIATNKYLQQLNRTPTLEEFQQFVESNYNVDKFNGMRIIEMPVEDLRSLLYRHKTGTMKLEKDRLFAIEASYAVKTKKLTEEEKNLYSEYISMNQKYMLSQITNKRGMKNES